jgi:hypothetical protein
LTPKTEGKLQEQRILTKPVTIRWGSDSNGRKLSLPAIDEAGVGALEDLIRACTPATFGLGGRDVFDETYRRAGALATDEFMTDFCPYEAGIIDVLAQLLLKSSGAAENGGRLPEVLARLPRAGASSAGAPGPAKALTPEQAERIRWVIGFHTGGDPWALLSDSQAWNCFQILKIPTFDEDEWTAIVARLTKGGPGCIEPEALFQVAAERMLIYPQLVKDHKEGKAKRGFARVVRELQTNSQANWRGIRAELYKLNVYSGPSRLFKPHVDTPRSERQIGSLVVCLPVPFKGGALAVRHRGQEIVHDWASGLSD